MSVITTSGIAAADIAAAAGLSTLLIFAEASQF